MTEFIRILRCFEPDYYRVNKKRLEEIFEEFADQEEENEKVISNQGFVVFANHFKLFDLKSHERFFTKSANSVELAHEGHGSHGGRAAVKMERNKRALLR